MKKVMILVAAFIMMVSLLSITFAEDMVTTQALPSSEEAVSLKITDCKYDGEMLTGKVVGQIPTGKLGAVSVTLFLSGNRYIQVPVTLINGEFELIYSEPAEYITMTPITFTRLSDIASRTYYYSDAIEYIVK